jgi:hypothetical protein
MKKTTYNFTKPNGVFTWMIDLSEYKPKPDFDFQPEWLDDANNITPSPEFVEITNRTTYWKFTDELYKFITNYNKKFVDRYKVVKYNTDRLDVNENLIDVILTIKNGVGKVSYFNSKDPSDLISPGDTYEDIPKLVFDGSFTIKKEDMINFLNGTQGKKIKKEKIVGSPISVPWTKKDYDVYIDLLKNEIEELKKQIKKLKKK